MTYLAIVFPLILNRPEFYLAAFIVLLLVISIMVLSYALNTITASLLESPETAPPAQAATEKKPTILQKLMVAATEPSEDEVLLDHNYDGITELDNSMPPWWVKLFYLTIITAIIYMLNYHVFNTGKLQGAEYETEMADAEKQRAEFRKLAANNIDEISVTQLTLDVDLSEGKTLFVSKCSPCHGKGGEGIVGPNLTDDYWLHGGGIKNVFKTIKYGIPQKGMIAWETQITPKDMQKIASYILSIKGSLPANPKAPQGDVYVEDKSEQTVALEKSK